MYNITITTECTADLPPELIKKYDIDIIYYDIETEGGLFRDTGEVSADNVMEYMAGGIKKAQSVVPSANDYKSFFHRILNDAEEIIHVCISSGVSEAYENAKLGVAKLGVDARKVHIIDSRHLSSGQGFAVLKAARLRDEGKSVAEIVSGTEAIVSHINTSFIARNADYLYYNGKVSKNVMDICRTFRVHPVLAMIDGKLTLKRVFLGNYDNVCKRYIKYTLKKAEAVDKDLGFFTHAGCGHEMIERLKQKALDQIRFDTFLINRASATVSCNCGPQSFGVLFIEGDKL